jgi:hypothetical protein
VLPTIWKPLSIVETDKLNQYTFGGPEEIQTPELFHATEETSILTGKCARAQ